MDRNKGSRKKLSKRQILLIAAVALAAVLLLTGRLTPAGLINSLLGTDIPEAQQTYESVQPAETAEDLPCFLYIQMTSFYHSTVTCELLGN